MLIRTRVILITLGFGLAIILGAAVELRLREDTAREQYVQSVIGDRSTLWRKVVEGVIQRMEDKAWIVAEDAPTAKFVATDNRTDLAVRAGELVAELRKEKVAPRLDIVGDDGTLLYSSAPSLFPTPIMAPTATKRLLDRGIRLRGIGNDAERNVAMIVGLPLRLDGRIVGAGVMATDIEGALEEMKASTGNEVLFVNRRGRALAGTDLALWDALTAGREIDLRETETVIDMGDSVQSLIMIPVAADLGNLVGWLVMAKDITASYRQQQLIVWVSAALFGLFLLLALSVLYIYLRHALGRLGTAVGALNALAQGDTNVQLDPGTHHDEVSSIGEAVGRLRKEMLAFGRLRRAREKQRDRQERFIRREMAGLAATLDPAARGEVLQEIEEIETRLEAQRQTNVGILDAQGAEGLGLMALAFEKMAARVRDQQGRMGELITELRAALETKTAYLALQQELEIAQRVQLASLPEALPATDDLELVGRMVPAREVGGDCYDFFELDDARIGIVVADVSGKGVPAALFMAIARTLLRAVAQRFDEPGPCLERLNELLVQNNHEELFVTVFYGIFDRRTGRLDYANGGHNPPVLLRGDQTQFLPRTGGMALAVFDDVPYAEASIDVLPGDTVLFFTDGITEAIGPGGEEYGVERLTARLVASRANPAGTMIELVLDDIRAFAGAEPQADDITCVALCYHGAVQGKRVPREDGKQWSAASSALAMS